MRTPYSKGTHLEFAGESANLLYFFIKNNKFNWNQLEQYGAFLGRIDTCYDRIQKSTDKISNDRFIDATVIQFKKILLKNNIEFRKNRSGQLTSVGHRTSDKYYRVYLKSDCLRFEFEHKHRETLNLYYNLLKTKKFKQLENRISYEFFKQTYQLFRYSQEPEKVEWVAQRLRPFQIRNSVYDLDATINIHYIAQCPIEQIQKVDLIMLFKLLAYVRSLDDYETAKLTSKFRKFKFPVREFLKFVNPGRTVNHRHLKQATEFFNYLKHNIVLNFLFDESYIMLVTIPEASANEIKNKWIAEVWVADEIFYYFEPFLFIDHFKQKNMTTDEFFVLFQIIKNFSIANLRKEFDIPKFFDSYPSQLNGTRKKKIKDWFIHYIKKLHQEGKIEEQVMFPLLSESNLKWLIKISDLNSEHLMEPFIIFEVIEVSFAKNI